MTDHCESGLDENYEENEDGSKLGRLFFTVKYSFEKTALIVTINKCSNLPAKDSTNKTRWEFRSRLRGEQLYFGNNYFNKNVKPYSQYWFYAY